MPIPTGTRKVTFFYEYKKAGFSESLYTALPVVNVPDEAFRYLAARLAFADDQMIATYVRISDGDAPRRADFLDLTSVPGMGGQITEKGCSPTDVVLLAMQTNLLARSPFFIHAFPAKFLQEDVVVPSGKWSDLLQAWGNYLGKSPWRIGQSTGTGVAFRKAITSGTPTKPRGCKYVVPDALTISAGNTVAIGGASKDGVGYAGRKVVTLVDSVNKTFFVGGASPVGDLGDTAYYTKIGLSIDIIAKIRTVRLTERKVGKPFALPHGRRAATLSLRR